MIHDRLHSALQYFQRLALAVIVTGQGSPGTQKDRKCWLALTRRLLARWSRSTRLVAVTPDPMPAIEATSDMRPAWQIARESLQSFPIQRQRTLEGLAIAVPYMQR